MVNIILISIFSSVVFGVIDSLFFLIAEDTLQNKIEKLPYFDIDMAELLTGGISAAIAIFISSFVKANISKNIKIIEKPYIESIGIILGTIIMIVTYKFYKIKKTIRNKIRKDK